jgi:hypothetical protein
MEQTVSQVNNVQFREFLMCHLENKFTDKDIYSVVATVNPANKRYAVSFNMLEKVNNTEHKIDMQVGYNFPTESSATLFKSLFENIHKKNSGILQLEQKGNKVLMKMEEGIQVTNKKRMIDSKIQQDNLTKQIGIREKNNLLSDVFIGMIDAFSKSGLCPDNEITPSKFQKRGLNSIDQVEKYEERINKGTLNSSLSKLYDTAMRINSVISNTLTKKIREEICKANDSVVNTSELSNLNNRIFRSLGSDTLENVLGNLPDIQNKFKNKNRIDQFSVTNFLREKVTVVKNLLGNEPKKEIEPEVKKAKRRMYS